MEAETLSDYEQNAGPCAERWDAIVGRHRRCGDNDAQDHRSSRLELVPVEQVGADDALGGDDPMGAKGLRLGPQVQ